MAKACVDLVYDVEDRPPWKQNILFALQQVLAVMAATILVPLLVNSVAAKAGVDPILSQSAALIGAGAGTIVYLIFTKFKSPVFLGSSFAFLPALYGAVCACYGYAGIILGAIFAGLVYVVIAAIVKKCGTGWIDKYLPPIIIGPTVALIGLSLASSAVGNMGTLSDNGFEILRSYATLIVGIVTLFVTAYVSVRASPRFRLYPFIIGILAGYLVACIFTGFGNLFNIAEMKIMDFTIFEKVATLENWVPHLTIVGAFEQGLDPISSTGAIISIAILFMPIAIVVFAEHLADHKNLGSIIGRDLIKEPGLHRTLLGDGVGSMVGAIFGGCPNTTYGESIGTVALSRNASTWTIFWAAIACIGIAFIYPCMVAISSIPSCVIGGICVALYGYIAVSGLRMFKDIDLNDAKNLYVVATILIIGIGGMALTFTLDNKAVIIGSIACALILGILMNIMLNWKNPSNDASESQTDTKIE